MSASGHNTSGGSYVDASGTIRARASPTFLSRLAALLQGAWTLLVLFLRSIMNPDVGSISAKDARRGGGGSGGSGGTGGGGSRYGTIRNTSGSACLSLLLNSRPGLGCSEDLEWPLTSSELTAAVSCCQSTCG